MSENAPSKIDVAAAISGMPWWLVLIWGILAVIIGIALVATPLVTIFYLILILGIYWFIGGIFTLISLISDRSNLGWKIFLGIISIIAGIAIITYPLYSSVIVLAVMVICVGFFGILIGITKLFEAAKNRDAGAGVLGILSIIFGMILLIYPYAAAIILPWIIGIIALIAGISAIIVSFKVKKAQAET